jgi:hypothetical protein
MRLLQTVSTHGVVHFIDPLKISATRRRRNGTYQAVCGSWVSTNGGVQMADAPFGGTLCAKCAAMVGKRSDYYAELWNDVLFESTWTTDS